MYDANCCIRKVLPVLLANQLTLAYATLVRVGDDILHGYVSCNVLVWIYSSSTRVR